MCKLIGIKIGGREIKVAEVKKESIENIIHSAYLCDQIEKIVLFGSSLEERCTENSDVDIAVFGRYPKSRMFRLKSYQDFIKAVVTFGKWQDYDVLYFDASREHTDNIIREIDKGEILYERV